MTLLVVTAVAAEADAVRAGTRTPATRPPAGSVPAGAAPFWSRLEVVAVGVGPAAAAAGTARQIALAEAAGRPYTGVLCAGIGGGFPGRARPGDTVLCGRSIAADLGAESPDGFLPLDRLGFGPTVISADPALLGWLRSALPGALVGDILTVSTVTGTAGSAGVLSGRYPDALAEGMEGYGAGCAATGADLPFAELRTVSNPIGPRDRENWRIGEALTALTAAAACLVQPANVGA